MTMSVIDITEATKPLSEYAQQAETTPTVILKDGQPVAVVVGIKNADLETISLSQNPQFLALIERSRTRQEREGGISPDEMRRKLGIPLPRQA
jgi:PHD/YefM family antitoxin component YafN of YafNO toxin-antitoxin module